MTDDTSKTGGPGPKRISLTEDYEVRALASDVEAYLEGKRT